MSRVAVALVLLATGCGESPSTTNEDAIALDASAVDTAVTDSTTPSDDTTAAEVAPDATSDSPDAPNDAIVFGPYPAGPYGDDVGQVVANLDWEGHVSPLADELASKKPYVTTSMDRLRRDARRGYALVHVSEFY